MFENIWFSKQPQHHLVMARSANSQAHAESETVGWGPAGILINQEVTLMLVKV
jgi:hypothetical protein